MSRLPSKFEFEALLQLELNQCSTPEQKYVKSTLTEIQPKKLIWEYGNDEIFDAWVFADFNERDVGAAYCLGGFGALGSPWGLIFFHDDHFGMDCGWYGSLADLYRDGWLDGVS